MLHIVMWKWHQQGFRDTYTAEHVNVMAAMIKRNMPKDFPHRLVLITDDPEGIDPDVKCYPLWDDFNTMANFSGKHLPSCYRRLRLFGIDCQRELDIAEGDRIMSIDIDAVIIGDLTNIVNRQERFIGWAVRGTQHLRVFNGSMWMFTAGDLEHIWTDFKPPRSVEVAHRAGYFGSDQAWMSYNLAKRDDCKGWAYPEVASNPREVVKIGKLDMRTRVIFFHGKDKPWHPNTLVRSPWIKRYWRLVQ